MIEKIALFNPDHDLALAHHAPHYVAPLSALQFASDCALLPLWLFPDFAVLTPSPIVDSDFQRQCDRLGIEFQTLTQESLPATLREVQPWGWNLTLLQRLLAWGIAPQRLPSEELLLQWRALSHRRTASQALSALATALSTAIPLPQLPYELTSLEEVEAKIESGGDYILKMPWSGSGRGVRRVTHPLTPHQQGWIRQSIRKQGSVMVEPFYSVVQDFAMEFSCGEIVQFEGYSLFQTQNGVYQQNHLLSDEQIEHYLQRWIPLSWLHEVRHHLSTFIATNVAPLYRGTVGVDMFVYAVNEGFRLYPAVELNLRSTMGLLAHRFYQNYVDCDSRGSLRMRYHKSQGSLQVEHQSLKERYPLKIENGKIKQGYLSLVPINAQTCYGVQVFVQ